MGNASVPRYSYIHTLTTALIYLTGCSTLYHVLTHRQ